MEDNKVNYNPFPLGQIPVHLQRPELHLLKALGKYTWNDDREVVDIFEKKLAEFWGSKYAVLIDSCTHSIELAFRYLMHVGKHNKGSMITVPARTYISAVMVLEKLGLNYDVQDQEWKGMYRFGGTPVIDSAVYWQKDGYVKNSLMCLSFQQKKYLCEGKSGAVLCDDPEAYRIIKLMSYDGRDLKTPYTDKDHVKMLGYHYYCTPEQASRLLLLMEERNESIGAYGGSENYPDIRIWGS